MDIVSSEKRHYIMSRIRGKDTSPEVIVRKYLFSKGLRFRKNDRRYPGHPDIVLPKYKTVIFVNGCFWHGHENCKSNRLPDTNKDFWRNKIERNKQRDIENTNQLEQQGWRVLTIWECEIKRKTGREERLEELHLSVVKKKP